MEHPDYVGDYERELKAELDYAAMEVASAFRRWQVPREYYECVMTCEVIGAVIVSRVGTLEEAGLIAPVVRTALEGLVENVAVSVFREKGVPWHIDVLACKSSGDIYMYGEENFWY